MKLKFIEKYAVVAAVVVFGLAGLGWVYHSLPPLPDTGSSTSVAQATADAGAAAANRCDKNLVMTADELRAAAARCGWTAASQPKPAAQHATAAPGGGVAPAKPAGGAAATTAPAPASTAAPSPQVLTPPPGAQAGMVAESVLARDQFDQWITLGQRVEPMPSLALFTPPTPAGASGTRRTVWDAWIKTTRPVQTVTLHVVGGSARVTARVDAWTLDVSHSDAWTTAPDQSQKVITLAAGWHRVTVTADQLAGAQPASVELQLGSANVDPVIPVPWAAQAAEPATSSTAAAAKPAASAAVGGSRPQPRTVHDKPIMRGH